MLNSRQNIHMMKKLRKIDTLLKTMDFDVFHEVTKVAVNITGNPSDARQGNSRLFEFGL